MLTVDVRNAEFEIPCPILGNKSNLTAFYSVVSIFEAHWGSREVPYPGETRSCYPLQLLNHTAHGCQLQQTRLCPGAT